MAWDGKWPGGPIWRADDGTRTYYIRRMVAGRRYTVSTRCTTLRSAIRALERFEADPAGFAAGPPEGLPMTDELIEAFVEHGLRVKGNTEDWAGQARRYLGWWKERLPADLGRTTLRDLDAALEGAANRAGRTNKAKAFFSWLRQTGRTANDPARDLRMPPARPAQWSRSKVIPRGRYEAVRRLLDPRWADLLTVLAGTGCHVSELRVFVERGRIEYPERGGEDLKVLVFPHHKGGGVHRVVVSDEVEEAAFRAIERGPFPRKTFYRAVWRACRTANPRLRPFNPGEFRATIATWAIEAGASPEAVSAFLGHRHPGTTKRFYAVHAIIPKVPTLE